MNNYLLQSQIHNSCRLALPEGLKDLMSDISREVLRAQPDNLYEFIANYLSALLVTKENLTIAGYLHNDLCNQDCTPELYSELKDIGFDDHEATMTENRMIRYLTGDKVGVSNVIKMADKRLSDEKNSPDVRNAVCRAFVRHQRNNTSMYQSSSDDEVGDVKSAVKHTLGLYKETKPTEQQYNFIAEKVQFAYNAYGVKRHSKKSKEFEFPEIRGIQQDFVDSLKSSTSSDRFDERGQVEDGVNLTSTIEKTFNEKDKAPRGSIVITQTSIDSTVDEEGSDYEHQEQFITTTDYPAVIEDTEKECHEKDTVKKDGFLGLVEDSSDEFK